MNPEHVARIFSVCLILFFLTCVADAQNIKEQKISFGIIGMAGGAVDVLKSYEKELNVRVTHLKSEKFQEDKLPDLSEFDAIITSFASGDLKDRYKEAIGTALKIRPELKVFCVGPGPICEAWQEWVGKDVVSSDPQLAQYYGLSNESMRDMLRYALVKYFGRNDEVPAPGAGQLVTIHHPEYGDEHENIEDFLDAASKDGWDVNKTPRVALGSWRHHVLFHQPKVIDAIIAELEKLGILAVCLVADDPKFTERLSEFKPDLVIMTSHTREPVEFWNKLGVPRIHALWFTDESIDEWRDSNQPGMDKSAVFHQIVSAEQKGAAECLTAGGTETGRDSGEEILPIPDRIRRIAERSKAWIDLSRKKNAEKKIAIMVYDREADKAGLMSGPAHNLNAPRSMVKLLNAMEKAGYGVQNIPVDEHELIECLVDHGRQMGSWEAGPLAELAGSGKAVLVAEDRYRQWFEEKVPQKQREEVIKQWGTPPGNLMVWESDGKRFLVLPEINLGKVILMTQPPKGETITSSTKVEDPDESLLPPTHHYLATYFWLQEEFKPDAIMHFGSHGSEWLFPGKQAVLSRADWSDILIGDMPNINPWLASNTSELLPCKRRAMAVTIDFLPSPLMEAGLSDELLNLESTIEKYESMEDGALKKTFAKSVTEQVMACRLDRDLKIDLENGESLKNEDIARISKHLHDLGNEIIPASMHTLGEAPAEDTLIPYLVYSMGKRFIDSAREVFGSSDETLLKQKGKDILSLVIKQGLPIAEAVKACGGNPAVGDKLPEPMHESLEMALEMKRNLGDTHKEIENILAALNGDFIPPGPSGNPERNPGVLPTGRNMFILNPEELPSRASWELGARLMKDYLGNEITIKGRYPQKIAFSLVPFATYSDFGIIESQIMYLIGVRPVWDSKNRVRDVELIPASELGRPRIDVFISARSIYRDELPSLMRLLDKAIRLAASQNEKDNYVFANTESARKKLVAQGIPENKAQALSQGRMFGAEPNEILDSHNWFFYLTERSGEWENREELLDVYIKHSRHIYTAGIWGEDAPEAFDSAIRGTELIFKSWYDNHDFVLSNKFAWWVDGTLSLAIKHITGKEPGYLFVDVRDSSDASIVDSTQVVQNDFRARVTNPKWIAAMMKEGYAGGNTMAKNIDNLMGWEIMREDSVADSNWSDITDVYVRDKNNLGLKSWFDSTNPHAFQKLSVTLLETIRKDFWTADEKTSLEIAKAYADSVVRHGNVGGIKEGGNAALESFVEKTISAPNTPELNELLKNYKQKMAELQAAPSANSESEAIQGKRLEKKESEENTDKSFLENHRAVMIVSLLALLIVTAGFFGRGHAVKRTDNYRKK